MLHAQYGDEVLCLPHCGIVMDEDLQFLWRGPRIRMGMCEGMPQRVVPHSTSGRCDYFGSCVNRWVMACLPRISPCLHAFLIITCYACFCYFTHELMPSMVSLASAMPKTESVIMSLGLYEWSNKAGGAWPPCCMHSQIGETVPEVC